MKYIKTNEWCISDNGELFTDGYYSREEAIEEVRKEYGRGYIGKEVHIEFDEQDILIPEIEQELSENYMKRSAKYPKIGKYLKT